jgi:hypothetical protein
MSPLDAETQAYIEELVDAAPPLSERQKDVIAGAFSDALVAQAGGGDAP